MVARSSKAKAACQPIQRGEARVENIAREIVPPLSGGATQEAIFEIVAWSLVLSDSTRHGTDQSRINDFQIDKLMQASL